MRNLRRNLQPVFFKKYLGEEEILDMWGNSTGSYLPIYGELQSTMICVSPNKGSSEVDMFGTLADYDRTMTTADINCKIDEHSVLWVDGTDTNGPWNYIVKMRSPWKNSVSYAIKRVAISDYQHEAELRKEQEKVVRDLKEGKVPANANNPVQT